MPQEQTSGTAFGSLPEVLKLDASTSKKPCSLDGSIQSPSEEAQQAADTWQKSNKDKKIHKEGNLEGSLTASEEFGDRTQKRLDNDLANPSSPSITSPIDPLVWNPSYKESFLQPKKKPGRMTRPGRKRRPGNFDLHFRLQGN
jgi:hypothetical protein